MPEKGTINYWFEIIYRICAVLAALGVFTGGLYVYKFENEIINRVEKSHPTRNEVDSDLNGYATLQALMSFKTKVNTDLAALDKVDTIDSSKHDADIAVLEQKIEANRHATAQLINELRLLNANLTLANEKLFDFANHSHN